MMQTMDCSEARPALGVYVLGVIDPEERALVDSHLATCPECRAELAGLAGLPAVLAQVSTEEALALESDEPPQQRPAKDDSPGGTRPPGPEPEPEASPELLGTVLDLTAARRRRRNWRNGILAAAAAVVIAAGTFGGVRLAVGNGPQFPAGTAIGGLEALPQGTSSQGLAAFVKYQPYGWGLQVWTRVVGIPVGTKCTIVALVKGGKPVYVASWTTDSQEGSVWYQGSAAVSDDNLTGFQINVQGHKPITVVDSD